MPSGPGSSRTARRSTTSRPAASTWPPSLVSASSSKRSSSTPTAQIRAPATEHDAGVAEDEVVAGGEERQLAGDDVGRDEAAEHRQPAEVGDRVGVHVAVAHRGDGAGAQRDLAGHDREQVGHRQGDQEDEEVLPHRQPSSVSTTPCSSIAALSCSSERAPRRSTRPSGTGDVDDRRRLAARRGAAVDDHRDRVAEHLLRRVGVGGGGPPGEVGRARRRADRCARGRRGRPRRRASAPRPCRASRRGPTRARPAGGRRASAGRARTSSTRVARPRGHALGERVERRGGGDQHRRRHVAAPALGVQQALHGLRGRRRRRRCRRRCRWG